MADAGGCTHFSTLGLPAHLQFDAWREHLSSAIEMLPASQAVDRFPARSVRWPIGDLTLSRSFLNGAPERAWRHVPRSHLDHWSLVLARKPGASRLSFSSLGHPFGGSGQDDDVIALWIPRDRMAGRNHALSRAQGAVLSGPKFGVLSSFLNGLAEQLPTLTPQEAARLAEATTAIVSACLTPSAEIEEAGGKSVVEVMVQRAIKLIRQYMADPAFNPNTLCSLMGVSRSKLYRWFEASGGVVHAIQKERLVEAHRRLTNLSDRTTIVAISVDVGFVDHSTFSRAFRREFGVSPSQVRAGDMPAQAQFMTSQACGEPKFAAAVKSALACDLQPRPAVALLPPAT